MNTTEHARAVRNLHRSILSMDMEEAEAEIARLFPTVDPTDAYWTMFEAAEMTAELAEDF
jgi:hypothetical protein